VGQVAPEQEHQKDAWHLVTRGESKQGHLEGLVNDRSMHG